jgi:hypothetical protein
VSGDVSSGEGVGGVGAGDRATPLVVTWLAALAGHQVGDYLVQLDRDARRKQERTRVGRAALARHVVTYGLAQAAVKVAVLRAAGVRTPGRAVVGGQVVEVLLHAVIDDGRLLRWFAARTGRLAFHDLNVGGVNGRALLDQAAHRGVQVPVGALVTTWLAGRAGVRVVGSR